MTIENQNGTGGDAGAKDGASEGGGDKLQQTLLNLDEITESAYERMDEEGNLKPEDPGAPGSGEKPGEDAGGEASADKPDGGQGDEPGAQTEEPGTGDAAKDGAAAAGEQKKDKQPTADDDLTFTEEEFKQLSERGRERFQKLSTALRESNERTTSLEGERDEYKRNLETISGVLHESRLGLQQLNELGDITKDLFSGSLEEGRRGVAKADRMVKEWAKYYGVKLDPQDMLSDFPDLAQQVDAGTISREAAEEIASSRHAMSGQQNRQTVQQSQVSELQQRQAEANQANAEVDTMLRTWAGSDPDWKFKVRLLDPYMKELAQGLNSGRLRPGIVPHLLKQRYDTVTETVKATSDHLRPQQRQPNPMRGGNQGAPASGPLPTSVEDAIEKEYQRM